VPLKAAVLCTKPRSDKGREVAKFNGGEMKKRFGADINDIIFTTRRLAGAHNFTEHGQAIELLADALSILVDEIHDKSREANDIRLSMQPSDEVLLGACLRCQRKELGLSQQDVKALVEDHLPTELLRGLSTRTLQSIEAGAHGPTTVLMELLKVLGGKIVFIPRREKPHEYEVHSEGRH